MLIIYNILILNTSRKFLLNCKNKYCPILKVAADKHSEIYLVFTLNATHYQFILNGIRQYTFILIDKRK